MRKENNPYPPHSDKNQMFDKEYPFFDGHIIVISFNQSGLIVSMNQSLLDMTGYQEKDLIGLSYAVFKHPHLPDSVYADLKRNVESGKRWKGLVKILRNDGGYFWGLATIKPDQQHRSRIGYLCTVRKPSQAQIEFQHRLSA
jgi:PAS domain S-box-containing protein